MPRRRSGAAPFLLLVLLGIGAALPSATPVKLARHPDYHAGRIAFSYLGDIWVANEDGTNVQRLTDNTAREVYPRFSPDGKTIAFSSTRNGNNDVYVVPSTAPATRWGGGG